MSAWLQCAFGLLGFSSEAIGPAAATITRHSGTTMTKVQVSSAEVIWLTCALSAGSRPARSAERASTGIIAMVSAPPRISWYSRSGTWFAVTYAVPRQLAPTVCENTSVRTRPSTREKIVRPATMRAPRAMPSASREPGSGSARPASGLVCTGNSRSPGMALHPSRLLPAHRIRIQLETYLGRRDRRPEEFLDVRKIRVGGQCRPAEPLDEDQPKARV
jgi:hypothetical protein